jgi:hypothetical protein
MKRLLLLLAVALLAWPATALAKGPSEASITGPGLGDAIKITGPEQEGSPLMDFAEAAGFFAAAFDQTPTMVTSTSPATSLGPKYSVAYKVPGPNGENFDIHQDLYPYAKPAGVTYMPSGQPIFDFETHGGWFTDSRLKEILVAKGLPKTAAAAAAKDSSSAGFFSTGKIGVFLLVLFGIGAVAVLTRRHLRSDSA